MNFLDALTSGKTLLADGATGTVLQTMGLPIGDAPEAWTIRRPDAVRELARLYAAAGSDLVYTNTFGASRVHLRRCGLEDQLAHLNQRAVTLAREGVQDAGETALVIGSIGPTGEMLEPYGEFSADEARQSFAEQAKLLAEAGVDALVCETFSDLNEALSAIAAVREATKLPVLASMAFDQNGRTMMGVTPEDAVAQLSDAGACAVGANCSVGPEALEQTIRAMRAARPNVRLLAKPNAGLPEVVDGQAVYKVGPAVLAEFARRMRELGVAVVGGCCGTTADHIRAMREAVG